MKLMKSSVVISALLSSAFLAAAATNDPVLALQKGLFEEEANHNLTAAIQAYQDVVTRFDKDRKLAATAVFRLGECYRKQGNTNEAQVYYERVVREFPDQEQLVTLSRSYLGTPAAAAGVEDLAPARSTMAERNEVGRIQALIKDSPDLINAKDVQQQTPLHKAAAAGQLVVARFLLDNGAEVDPRDGQGQTPLIKAACCGHKSMVELLLSHKANIEAADNTGGTALHWAAAKGFRAVAETLLDHGAQVNAKDNSAATPLNMAAACGFKAVAELLLDKGADPDPVASNWGTPLHGAASPNDRAMAELLLAHKANPNAGDGSGLTPLHIAAQQDSMLVAELLLAHGAEVNAKDNVGWTPLDDAVANAHPAMAALFLKGGADPNTRFDVVRMNRSDEWPSVRRAPASGTSMRGYTPLLVATHDGQIEIMSALLAAKADPNAKTEAGLCPVFEAVFRNNPAALKLLLASGAAPDPRLEEDQATPLIRAFWNANLVDLLIANGADVNARDRDGCSALIYVVSNLRHPQSSSDRDLVQIVKLLVEKGADVNAISQSGETPLSIALQPQFSPAARDLVPFLREHGAMTDVPRPDLIRTRRASSDAPSTTVFSKDINNWNHFTLSELIGFQYGWLSGYNSSQPAIGRPIGAPYGGGRMPPRMSSQRAPGENWRFPDFAHLHIRRPAGDLKSWREEVVDFTPVVEGGDCSKDIPLQWGDVVEIPELDHPLNQVWAGFSAAEKTNLFSCLTRQVEIIVKGESHKVTLTPNKWALQRNVIVEPASFWIGSMLRSSNLLLTSSDLSRVKVTRQVDGQRHEWIIDCSQAEPGLWLRDGDIIEVPEKP